jgi:hypothetical protein
MVCGKVAKNQHQVENLKIRLIAMSLERDMEMRHLLNPRINDTGSRRLRVSLIRGVADSAYQ